MKFTLDDVRSQTYKARDAWWTVFLVDPLAGRLVLGTANRTSITPNQITWGAFLLGLGSAGCFLTADRPWLIVGAALYHLSFVLDCMDGKIARLKGTGTVLGGWLDYVFDRIRVLTCALALMWGQFQATGQELYLILGIGVVFLDMLRYVDALQIAKVRRQMRRTLKKAYDESTLADPSALPDRLREDPDLDPELDPDLDSDEIRIRTMGVVDLQEEFRSRFAWYIGVREWLRDHRVRTHLISGIEFQMAVFIIGPVLGYIVPVTVGAAALLLVFEVAIMYKLWLSSRDLARALAEIRRTSPQVQATAGN
ncbi:CDP-alcohol phosphatidyltransferase family protein [Microtetraspora sp. AC03309]|uniref:CDP-alcohol phosphatidyltransferase family protein n=1 Tax=Microtetraspora sp. AC03309 TaxID=2779376 RepID=UPI001E4A836B|nr:CDP-alcohol phosphatidyltransferase family protein [Microtetraspora sp. AC03309]MCC5580728.1 CDP-alcohol phosphatidyltransferase family protein [Microtetraspora sp. AC03309]